MSVHNALYRTYRPASFADVAGQEHVKKTLQNQLASGRLAHAYLFTGPRGTGKTTVARLLAKAANCEKGKDAGGVADGEGKAWDGEPCNTCAACLDVASGSSLDVFEIDAASHTDVDNVRENVIRSVRVAPNRLRRRVYVIDEVHMLSTAAFNALLKTLEEPPAHALFVLATTEIHKVPATIVSRCQRFDFRRIPADQMVARLHGLAEKEGMKVDEDVLRAVARHSDGCERDAESVLGQLFALGETHVTAELASLVLPATSSVLVADFLEALLRRDAALGIRLVNAYVEQGVDLPHFTDEVIETLRGFLFWKLGGEAAAPSFDTALGARLSAAAPDADPTRLTHAIRTLLESRRGMKTDRIPQLGLELAVVELAAGAAPASPVPPASAPPAPPAGPAIPARERPPSPPTVAGRERVLADKVPSEGTGTRGQEAPPSLEAKAVVFDSVPVVDADELRRKWPDVFAQIQHANASLPLVVQAAQISSTDGDMVEFNFQYELHANVVNQEKNRRLLEAALKKVFGKDMRVRGTYARPEAPAETAQGEANPEADAAVSDILQAFGGSAA